GGPIAVLLGEADHRVLDDVQRRFVVANGIERALESPLLHALQEVGEFFFGSQEGGAGGEDRRRRARLYHRTAQASLRAPVQQLRCNNAAPHTATGSAAGRPTGAPLFCPRGSRTRLTRAWKGATDGFSSEINPEVSHGHVCRGS